MTEFTPGDVVALKSAPNRLMTVEFVRRGEMLTICVWFDDLRHVHREPFPIFLLEKREPLG